MCFKKPKTEEKSKNNNIESEIKKEKKNLQTTHRIPIVGAGESGKSTLIKQMQILYISDFTDAERKSKVPDIKRNIRDSLLAITAAMTAINPPVELEHKEYASKIDYLQQETMKADFQYPPEFFVHCRDLWSDKGVAETFRRSNEFQLIDCARYFLDRVDEVAAENYLPSNQDILRCRVLTSGIFETKFTYNKTTFHMFDVGGQRDERRKWIQVFHDITGVIFVTACSAYDMTLRENTSQNRLQESIDVFKEVWNNRFLKQQSVILFLNKQDLFTEKIKKGQTKLETFFPQFTTYPFPSKEQCAPEDKEVVRAKFFIRDRYLVIAEENNEGGRRCYPHFTTAVDTENVKRVFADCQEMLRRIYMQKMNLL